ncbi:carbohydrate ABC transporter permease [Paenibacillus ginsengihumi]|uniref:carbohydrate ABC transporter permease n=1 Tax=Paenibacillus ginsengihumi TaxID=431596 RepID=UPI000370D4B3|nr:carbohydrate ABC transporter permease [Paenibacillus ginsengihumi]
MPRKPHEILFNAVLWLMIAAFVFPLMWLVMTSLKTRVDAFSLPPKFIFSPTFVNYAKVLEDGSFLHYYANSLKVGLLSTFFSLLIGIPAAYALARFPMRKKEDFAFWVLSTRMAPPIMVILPFFLVYKELHLLDTTVGLVIIYMTFSLSFILWMMRSYFESISVDIEDAARIDGFSRLMAFIKVTIPLSAPGIAAASIFSFIMSWNEFLYSLILTGDKTKTATVAITSFITFEGIRWGEVAAAGTMIVLPVIVFGICIQKYLVQGMTMGGVK